MISAVYKIVNIVTGDFYVGSSKNVMKRWAGHKCQSTWKEHPNKQLYLDMQKYGLDKFRFQILAPVIPECLKQVEQEFIEMLKPTYNDLNAKGRNVERRKESNRKYHQSNKYKEYQREYQREYHQSEKGKESDRKSRKKYFQSTKGKESIKKATKKYFQSEKGKESLRKSRKKYNNQLCLYKGEELTLCALASRFRKAGVEHPTLEAKKYLIREG